MTTSAQWLRMIESACAEPEPAHSNRLITKLHYLLSAALANRMGRDGGPNFHSWAVWGSLKAGVTIRQEDLDSAINNATMTAGIVGSVVGAAMGILAGHWLLWAPNYLTAATGAGIGTFTGGWAGRQIAIWSRGKAA